MKSVFAATALVGLCVAFPARADLENCIYACELFALADSMECQRLPISKYGRCLQKATNKNVKCQRNCQRSFAPPKPPKKDRK